MDTVITNVQVFTREERFVPGALAIDGGIIRAVARAEEPSWPQAAHTVDGQGAYCLPGLIDMHFHGCAGHDICDGTQAALVAIADYELSIGVTSIAPATMTLPVAQLCEILRCAADFRRAQAQGAIGGARLVGVNLEGPFISRLKKGAQQEAYIRPCDADCFRQLQQAGEGLIKVVGIAPEEGDAAAFIRAVREECVVSLAHTNADYATAAAAFDAGATHVTHLFNAMSAFHHRDPGVVGAAAERDAVWAELICDGIHVHPAMVRAALKLFGPQRLIFISDSMRATGMPDGQYTLGGQAVVVRGNRAVLADGGALAGSVTSLPDCVRTAVTEMGLPLATAVACATIHPAQRLGIADRCGSLEPGKQADLVLWDRQLRLQAVMQQGVWIEPGKAVRHG